MCLLIMTESSSKFYINVTFALPLFEYGKWTWNVLSRGLERPLSISDLITGFLMVCIDDWVRYHSEIY